jgi:hypothetical protein
VIARLDNANKHTSSGNMRKVQNGMSSSSSGSAWDPYDSVLNGTTTCTCPLGPSVPGSISGRWLGKISARYASYRLEHVIKGRPSSSFDKPGNASRVDIQSSLDVIQSVADDISVLEEFVCEDVLRCVVNLVETCSNAAFECVIHAHSRRCSHV